MNEIIGRVMTVAGSQMTVQPEADRSNAGSFRIGVMVKTRCADREVVVTISAIRCEGNDPAKRLLIADLLGEIVLSDSGISRSAGV
jgi:hypothetical protein